MSIEAPGHSGAAPLVRLYDLPTLEQRVVVCARLWRADEVGRAELERDLAARHGTAVGRAAFGRLEDFLGLVCDHSRRRIEIGAVASVGVTGDECVLARLVALAAEGAREEAILISALLIRADMALELARRAMAVGHLLLRRPGSLALVRT